MLRKRTWRSLSRPAKIIAICLAAVFFVVNIRSGPFLIGYGGRPEDGDFDYSWADCRGWPLHYWESERHQVCPRKHAIDVAAGRPSPYVIPRDGNKELGFHDLKWGTCFGVPRPWMWTIIALVVNIITAIVITAVPAVACEFFVRRAQRRGDDAPSGNAAQQEE